MKIQQLKFAVLVFVSLGSIAFLVSCLKSDDVSLVQAQTKVIAPKEIEDYKKWTKVNDSEKMLEDALSRSCALLKTPKGEPLIQATSPHLDKYITVYVNDIGRKAMLEQLNPKFPEGSVIVKEKLPDEKSQTPELMTVMIKQKEGFNPESGDWEYMVVNGSGKEVEARGKLENCQDCHFTQSRRGYVFREYLSREQYKKLK